MLLPLLAAILVASLLGGREAFRYRLLAWSPRMTSLVAFALVLAWLGIGVWTIVRVGLLAAALVLVVSFVIGNVVRIIIRGLSGGMDLMSPEADARRVVEHRLASARAATAVNALSMREAVARHALATEQFLELYDRLMATGVGHETALDAMARLDVVSWYFDTVPRGGRLSLDQSLQLIALARSRPTEPNGAAV